MSDAHPFGAFEFGVFVDLVVAEDVLRFVAAGLVADATEGVGSVDLLELPVLVQKDSVLAAERDDLVLRSGFAVDSGALVAACDLFAGAVDDLRTRAFVLGSDGVQHRTIGEFHGDTVVGFVDLGYLGLRGAVGEVLGVEGRILPSPSPKSTVASPWLTTCPAVRCRRRCR